MNATTLLREQIQQAHGLLAATMEDVTAEQAHWLPPGTANPLGATYVHAVAGEDAVVHMILQGGTPLYAAGWAEQTGVSEIQPLSTSEWARRVQVDLPALRRYAQAVHAATYAYLATLADIDLARTVDLSNLGMGQVTVGYILSRLLVGHVDNMCGEISCLKGLQGGRGYPM
jgi:DinB family protein